MFGEVRDACYPGVEVLRCGENRCFRGMNRLISALVPSESGGSRRLLFQSFICYYVGYIGVRLFLDVFCYLVVF